VLGSKLDYGAASLDSPHAFMSPVDAVSDRSSLCDHLHDTIICDWCAWRHLVLQDYIRKKNKWLVKIHEWVQAHGGDPIIPFSGAFENEVRWGSALLAMC
jgi:hypothetical protein